MSIINTFDISTEAIINPSSVVTPVEGFPKIAIGIFGERTVDVVREKYSATQIDALYACVTMPIYKINFEGVDIAVFGCTLGGPVAVGSMEEIFIKGCEKILYVGSCGVLDREIAEAALIVPTAAYRDEGTSYHYAPSSDYIDIASASKLSTVFSGLKLPHTLGKTWTTDAFYRETRGNMEKRKAEGCITVEMECASIMAAAQFRGYEAYQFFYAADNLDEDEWDARLLGGFPQDAREKVVRISIETAVRL